MNPGELGESQGSKVIHILLVCSEEKIKIMMEAIREEITTLQQRQLNMIAMIDQ